MVITGGKLQVNHFWEVKGSGAKILSQRQPRI